MNGLAQEKGKGKEERTPALSYTSICVHILPSEPTFAH